MRLIIDIFLRVSNLIFKLLNVLFPKCLEFVLYYQYFSSLINQIYLLSKLKYHNKGSVYYLVIYLILNLNIDIINNFARFKWQPIEDQKMVIACYFHFKKIKVSLILTIF